MKQPILEKKSNDYQKIRVEKIKDISNHGCFKKGSVTPKITTTIKYVEKAGNKEIIASIKKAKDSIFLKTGTIIYK